MGRTANNSLVSGALPARGGFAKPHLEGVPDAWEEEDSDLAEHASVLAELTDEGVREARWRIHDRTHLELAVDYPLEAPAARRAPVPAKAQTYVWEAYFFVPRSLRLHAASYSREDIYRDLQSYVRFAVPPLPLDELARVPEERLRPVLAGDDADRAVRELRLFACMVRASTLVARQRLRRLAEDESAGAGTVELATRALLAQLRQVLVAFRAELGDSHDSGIQVAARWVDEDVSRVVETILATLSIRLRRVGRPEAAELVAGGAVAEARYRATHGHDGVGHAGADKREIEHLEFRRHLLKRFTSSVLWLRRQVSEGGRWTLHALYAIAACVAMAFAILAAFYHGTDFRALGDLWTWALVVMVAYAGKDRIKATLQSIFSKWVTKRFPDRRWKLTDRDQGRRVGSVAERSAFVDAAELPPEVRAVRNSTRQHQLEEQARPERILWHQKTCTLKPMAAHAIDPRFASVTEIFRLDLSQWLVHTDDPRQRIHFADAETRHVYSAMAPRVYNLGIVYRVHRKDEPGGPWKRVRVVVSRKGIRRIEEVR